jgi:rSAM/selenodomain-associated transferase 1
MSEEACAILMVKYPMRGQVKSRLARDIGDNHAMVLYKLFVEDMVKTLREADIFFRVAYAPESAFKLFREWLGEESHYLPQIGDGLGQRLMSAFEGAFAMGADRAVALGSDAPDLPASIVSEALGKTEEFDSVIGPCLDGGYYLIGFRRDTFLQEIFNNVEWSTARIFRETMDILHRGGLSVHVLPAWRDIDEVEDLRDLYRRNRGTSALKSIAYLKENEHILE